jgi:HPt (histidine-containing phosphotransfer) domain-containing protein
VTEGPTSAEQFNPDALDMLRRLGNGTLLVRMIDIFLANGPARIAAARDALQTSDLHAVELAVHSLKSSSAQLGGAGVQRLAAAAERSAAAGDVAALPAELDRIDAEFALLREWLERAKAEATTATRETPP